MAVKIRLARHGRKASPFYHIVAADSRAPRDGKFIEKIGTYNPMSVPAKIELKFESALKWLDNGAEPTATVKNILQQEGVLYMKHLLGGVKKGAFDEKALEVKFQAWLDAKRKKDEAVVSKLSTSKQAALKARLQAEAEVSAKRADEIAKKLVEAQAQEAASEAADLEEEVAKGTAEIEGETTEATEAPEAPAAE